MFVFLFLNRCSNWLKQITNNGRDEKLRLESRGLYLSHEIGYCNYVLGKFNRYYNLAWKNESDGFSCR